MKNTRKKNENVSNEMANRKIVSGIEWFAVRGEQIICKNNQNSENVGFSLDVSQLNWKLEQIIIIIMAQTCNYAWQKKRQQQNGRKLYAKILMSTPRNVGQ